MKDRYKYKVWDKKLKVMYPVWCLTPYGAVVEDLEIAKREIPFNDCVIMQCTGIQDEKNKLIYEGDIIEVQYLGAQISLFKNEYTKQPENERFEVFCDEDWLKFYAKNDHYRNTCEIHSFDLEKIRTNTYNKVYEVIGNIYENPELLEEQCANQLNKG